MHAITALGEIKDGNIFEGRAFSQFVTFVLRSTKTTENTYDTLYEMLYKRFVNSLVGLLEESMAAKVV